MRNVFFDPDDLLDIVAKARFIGFIAYNHLAYILAMEKGYEDTLIRNLGKYRRANKNFGEIAPSELSGYAERITIWLLLLIHWTQANDPDYPLLKIYSLDSDTGEYVISPQEIPGFAKMSELKELFIKYLEIPLPALLFPSDTDTPATDVPENIMTPQQAGSEADPNDHEAFIQSLEFSCVSDTEVRIRGGNRRAETFDMRQLGFKKPNSNAWRAFRDILTRPDHLHHVGRPSVINRRQYDAMQKILPAINKKLVPFLNRTYGLQLPENFKVYELVRTAAPGTYRFKFRAGGQADAVTADLQQLSRDGLLLEIENLSREHQMLSERGDETSEARLSSIQEKLYTAITIACQRGWLPENRAAYYLNPRNHPCRMSSPMENVDEGRDD